VVKFIIKLLMIITCLSLVACSESKHFAENEMVVLVDITDFNQEINTKEKAKEIIFEWLENETNFDFTDNGIDNINRHKDYYEIRLKTSININGRESGVIGYRDYVMTIDGKLKGCYYSK
jgi:hypothetical protein